MSIAKFGCPCFCTIIIFGNSLRFMKGILKFSLIFSVIACTNNRSKEVEGAFRIEDSSKTGIEFYLT